MKLHNILDSSCFPFGKYTNMLSALNPKLRKVCSLERQKRIYCRSEKQIECPYKMAVQELTVFDQKWGIKYPYAVASWKLNWDNLMVFFDFTIEIWKIIYTTNLIENLNGKI